MLLANCAAAGVAKASRALTLQGDFRQQNLHHMTLAGSWASESLHRCQTPMQLQIRANPTPTGQLCLQQLLMQQTNRFTIFHLVKMLGTKGVKSIACQQHASHAKNAEHVIRAVNDGFVATRTNILRY